MGVGILPTNTSGQGIGAPSPSPLVKPALRPSTQVTSLHDGWGLDPRPDLMHRTLVCLSV